MIKEPIHDKKSCNQHIMAVHDAMYILNGRWKISIIASLCFNTLRFTDLLREVEGISGKMLSRELKNLEENQLVTRTVLNTQPVTVEYELTEYGHTLKEVIDSLAKWGHNHRKKITGKD
ncbi:MULTISPECIES: winged helix-turn-helix transcriptional regulator [Flavobacterium]|jgi:DNA-binding HxlR family transcriptional regulator|uniref:HTH-type transcriptional regulator YtcD n=1 Tax=Flavobacterium anhuiense TaxID=459526 RepID=A0AAC9GLG7_9FLAO|nr:MULTISPECIES: helix-turn-helix domain-containing protein [Flavobacterium]AOC97206.1 putative HTH-type transcriptional regulator YtcD [Flavobacterium anhuiense]KAF2082289.1 helix-turn-helix transcriptional regulator [Flavobacterium sharifuzzamanii]MDQ6531418.1 helix-turn-helix domain-containing protein [Flavobacterium sp. LHD-85]URM35493.1 helix-turn-helix transcriptional regulator [Flavobacterium anhuiense]SCY51039.1 transcriptional regulator, HxlR family [Flavobacterium anhuiense]